MGKYKHWTQAERTASSLLTKKAKSLGLIPPPTKCQLCGQTEGIIQSHNEDYDYTLEVLPKVFSGELMLTEQVKRDIAKCLDQYCWRCHMMHHSRRRAPAQTKEYFDGVKAGKMWPPVFKHDFGILKRDHNVF